MSKEFKKVQVVNERDEVTGAEYLFAAMDRGLLMRAARIFVFNDEGELLIQERSRTVLNPLLLDQSAAGHVDEGETYEVAAYRELEEELGVTGVTLTEVLVSFRTPGYFNAAYRLDVGNDFRMSINPHEIERVLWLDPAELQRKMRTQPERFTAQFLEAWRILAPHLVQ